jgi:hypothetical protein
MGKYPSGLKEISLTTPLHFSSIRCNINITRLMSMQNNFGSFQKKYYRVGMFINVSNAVDVVIDGIMFTTSQTRAV